MKLDGRVFTLECSGRTFKANQNIIGVDGNGELTEGFDSGLYPDWKGGDDLPFSEAERREIAEYMIQRWTAYRDSLTDASAPGSRDE